MPLGKEDVKQSNVTKKMRLWVAAVRLNVTNAELLRRSSESICSSHLPQLVSRVEYTFLYRTPVQPLRHEASALWRLLLTPVASRWPLPSRSLAV
eukprot:scaffold6264_cov94-Phaeocystis_antarctica.AAC.2